MKYWVSLMFGGLLFVSTLAAQNSFTQEYVLDELPVVSSAAEKKAMEVSSREFLIMESSSNDYSSTIWSRDIYRQISNTEGNESFFLPEQSSNTRVNLFSLLINLLSNKAIVAYKYEEQPELNDENILKVKDLLQENTISFTENTDNTVTVNLDDIPADKISHYLVKEKWYFDAKTGKGDVRVTDICPVLSENGKHYPMFWIHFDDISSYLARTVSPISVNNNKLANVSLFDIFRNRYYRGCIYQVGLRHLTDYFPDMKDMIAERLRLENELDYIQSKFYAADRKR